MTRVTDELRVLVEAEVSRAVENFRKLEGGIDHAAGKTEKLGAALDEAGEKAKNAAGDIGEIKKAFGGLAEVAALAAALSAVKDMGAFALQTADSFQTARNRFGTLLGDMKAGAGLFNEIKAFNDKTPFDLSTLTQAANVLVAAKVPLKDLQAQLAKFGDLSQGNSQKLTGYVNAFSQAAAKGKADMQVLNTYIHQGVPVLDALAKNFGVTTAEIVDMSSKGQISFADFSKALDGLAAAGGQYFGGMELSSRSLAAVQEGLSEAVNSLAASFGDMLLPAAASVLDTLTGITGAINESPVLKGALAGALVALTGYMAAMAVKSAAAFAAQMSLNFAVGAMNPAVMAATVAAAGLAAAYTGFSARAQKASRETENLALAQRKQNEAMRSGGDTLENYLTKIKTLEIDEIRQRIEEGWARLDQLLERGIAASSERIRALETELVNRREEFISELYRPPDEDKIRQLSGVIELAQKFLLAVEIDTPPEEKEKLEAIIKYSREEINKLKADTGGWRKTLKSALNFSDGDIAAGLLSTGAGAIDEYARRLEEAEARALSFGGVLEDEAAVLRNTAAQWEKLLSVMAESGHWEQSEESVQKVVAGLQQAREAAGRAGAAEAIGDLKQKIKDFGKSEVDLARDTAIAAGASAEQAEEIARLAGEFRRTEILAEYNRQIDEMTVSQNELAIAAYAAAGATDAELAAFKGTLALRDEILQAQKLKETIEGIRESLVNLGANAALGGLEELGKALGQGAGAGDAMKDALAAMSREILNALPNMFLQAGLQLIAQGQWPLGLGFVAAAGSTAVIKGYTGGRIEAEQAAARNARGNVFDADGIRAFARGGAFTNQIVQAPTLFRFARGAGLMGEAGPEAIMPLKRMADGNLGVRTEGGGANVTVTVINNTGAGVRTEERDDGNGGKDFRAVIGDLVNGHIASGKADRVLGGRYGLRTAGV
jgi:tape measure domain-containing protein